MPYITICRGNDVLYESIDTPFLPPVGEWIWVENTPLKVSSHIFNLETRIKSIDVIVMVE